MVVKLSANTLSWSQQFGAGKMTLLDMIEECYNLRLDGVSPAQPHFASTDDEYLEEVKQAAIRRGLHFDYIGVSTNHAQLGEKRADNIANLKKWIDVAAKMGIPMVRTFGGWLREGVHSVRVAPDGRSMFKRMFVTWRACAFVYRRRRRRGFRAHCELDQRMRRLRREEESTDWTAQP